MRCTSTGFRVARRTASTTTGPIVMLGTKRPSITSTWIQSAPASSTARTSSASRPKSADRIDGATITDRFIGSWASCDRPPPPAAAPKQGVCRLRAGAARRVYLERGGLVVFPQIEDRLHNRPPGFDRVGPVEQHRVTDHAVINQGLVARGRLGVKVILVREIHPHPAERDLRTRDLRAELHRRPFVWLDLQGENIGRQGVDRGVAKHRERRLLELNGDLSRPPCHTLAGTQIKRDTGPAPIVDAQLHCDIGL